MAAARKPKRNRDKESSGLKPHTRILLMLLTGLIAAFIVYALYLNWEVTRKFEGRRWDLPAQVYARPLELYAGLTIDAAGLEQELRRLGYRRVNGAPQQPGSYRRQGARIELTTRPFRFWDAEQQATFIIVQFDGQGVSRMSDGRTDMPLARLDPMLVGSLFAAHGEDRMIVGPTQVHPLLPAALKAVEDRRFDTHLGVDPIAMGRALISNLVAGEVTQGGSTLTQQLVKNYFLDNRRTLWRKIQEALMAVILELHYEKDDLMNAYINEIYMGQDGSRAINGFGLASQFYFSRPLAELELQQVALLVALVRGPTWYNPYRQPQRAKERRDMVLNLMAEAEIITAKEAENAIARPLDTWDPRTSGSSYHPGYLQLVRRELAAQYQEDDLTNEGLQVFTALDPAVQAAAERRLAEGLKQLDSGKSDGAASLTGAVAVTSTQSGEVLALVGDRRPGFDGFNRALDAQRPIGSLVKPAVYLAALESGRYTLANVVDDAPITVELENGDKWQPKNYDGKPRGPVTLVRALAESLNLATVRVGMDTGVARVAKLLQRLGARDKPQAFPSLLLGALELTPLEVAQIYGTFANGGFRAPLRAVRSVIDAQGTALQHYPMEVSQAADPAAVYQLNQGLIEVFRRGTAARANLPRGLIAAGKTGTSDQYRDSWFAGFTGDYVMVVWTGYDDNRSSGLTGSSGALGIWSAIMRDLHSSSYAPLQPASLESHWIDYASGMEANPDCADVVSLALPLDTPLQVKPGCGEGLSALGERAAQWLEKVLN